MGNNKNYGWQNKKELNETRTEQARQIIQTKGDAMPMEDKITGSSGGLGLVAGAGLKVASSAFKLISNVLGRGKKVAKSTSTVREIANESLRRGLNKGDKINPTY